MDQIDGEEISRNFGNESSFSDGITQLGFSGYIGTAVKLVVLVTSEIKGVSPVRGKSGAGNGVGTGKVAGLASGEG